MTINRRDLLKNTVAGAIVFAAAGAVSAQDLIPVTIAVATRDINIGYPGATLPLALGYFREEGLDVKIVPGQATGTTVQLLLTGSVNLGIAVPDGVMVARARDKVPLVSVYAISRQSSFRIGMPKNSPVNKIQDLEGKTVGVSDLSAASVVYLKARLNEAGIDTSKMHTVAIGYGAPAAEALMNGTVSAMCTFNGAWARYGLSGYEFKFLEDAKFQTQVYSYNMFSTQDYLDKNKDVVAKVGRAIAKATVFLKTNPEAAVKLFWQQYPDRAPADVNDPAAMQAELAILRSTMIDMRLHDLPVDFAWGSQDEDVWTQMQSILVDAKQIETPLAAKDYYTDENRAAFNDFDLATIVKQAEQWK